MENKQARSYRYFDRIMAFFVTILLVSNIASSAKIVDWGVSCGVPLAFDAGTLLFPVSYIFGDVLTEVYGYRHGRRVIWTGFACSLLMSLALWVVSVLPGEANWRPTSGKELIWQFWEGLAAALSWLPAWSPIGLGSFPIRSFWRR